MSLDNLAVQENPKTEYTLPNGIFPAIYAGVEELRDFGRCFCFESGTPAPDWFRLNYVPVKGASLRRRKIISEKGVVYTEPKYMPQIPEMNLMIAMRTQIRKLTLKGATA